MKVSSLLGAIVLLACIAGCGHGGSTAADPSKAAAALKPKPNPVGGYQAGPGARGMLGPDATR